MSDFFIMAIQKNPCTKALTSVFNLVFWNPSIIHQDEKFKNQRYF